MRLGVRPSAGAGFLPRPEAQVLEAAEIWFGANIERLLELLSEFTSATGK